MERSASKYDQADRRFACLEGGPESLEKRMKKETLGICLPLVAAFALAILHYEAAAQIGATNDPAATLRTILPAPQWRAKSRDAHQTEWQTFRSITNSFTRRVRTVTNYYVELATGLNYRDPATGRWKPSDPAFHITERRAESTAGEHIVLLAPDIGTLGSVTARKSDLTNDPVGIGLAY